MERKIPWLKIATAAAVVATAAVGIALFIKKKLDDLRLREQGYDFFDDDDECEFYDCYNPMDEVVIKEDDENKPESEEKSDVETEQTVEETTEDVADDTQDSEEEKEI